MLRKDGHVIFFKIEIKALDPNYYQQWYTTEICPKGSCGYERKPRSENTIVLEDVYYGGEGGYRSLAGPLVEIYKKLEYSSDINQNYGISGLYSLDDAIKLYIALCKDNPKRTFRIVRFEIAQTSEILDIDGLINKGANI